MASKICASRNEAAQTQSPRATFKSLTETLTWHCFCFLNVQIRRKRSYEVVPHQWSVQLDLRKVFLVFLSLSSVFFQLACHCLKDIEDIDGEEETAAAYLISSLLNIWIPWGGC